MPSRMRLPFWLTLPLVVLACAAPRGDVSPSGERAREASRSPKRVTVAITAEPPGLHYALIPSPIRATPGSIQEIVHPGLAVFDNQGVLRPVLAEAVPSIENGLWKLLPDGRMEMTWNLRSDATWHDATPVTSADLDLTITLLKDRELAVFRDK